MNPAKPDHGWQLATPHAAQAAERTWEFAAFRAPGAALPPPFPAAPGAVTRDAGGQPALLHFAPGRWLAPASAIDAATLAAAIGPLGSVFDVGGKWQRLSLSGPRAARLLASTCDAAAVLQGRACAALELFDCPSILAIRPPADGPAPAFDIWVLTSYLEHFLDAAQRTPLEPSGDL